MKLQDAYLSVHEALKHAGSRARLRRPCALGRRRGHVLRGGGRAARDVDGVLVPGGFGSRGWEGKILACQVARERRIPYLGICLGMHVAVSEFARHVVGLDGANSTEMDPETPFTRSSTSCRSRRGSRISAARCASARRRSSSRRDARARAVRRGDDPRAAPASLRGNNTFRDRLVEAGLVVSGTFQEGRLVEIVELADHPWFVASQFHPEFKSRPTRSAPLFCGFVGAALDRARVRAGDRVAASLPAVIDACPRCRPPPASSRRSRARPARIAAWRTWCCAIFVVSALDLTRRLRVADRLDRREPLRAARADGRRDAALPLRASGHGAAGRRAATGRRGRHSSGTPAARSSVPTTRRRSRDARGRAARAWREHPARGDRARAHAEEEVGLVGAWRVRPRRASARSWASSTTRRGHGRDRPRRTVVAGHGIRFHGRAAHAGMAPEEGRSAIQAAAKAIADLRLGRVDEVTTANVGHDHRRHRGERRPGSVHVLGGGALPRRGEAGGGPAGDARHLHLRRDRVRSATWRP